MLSIISLLFFAMIFSESSASTKSETENLISGGGSAPSKKTLTVITNEAAQKAFLNELTASLKEALSTSIPQAERDLVESYYGDGILISGVKGAPVTVDIVTSRLSLCSLTLGDIPALVRLFGDKDVMAKFAERLPRAETAVTTRVRDLWIPRWHKGDPRGGFLVRNGKNESLGFIILGSAGDTPPELAYLYFKSSWGKGYAKEAASALVKRFVPRAMAEKLLKFSKMTATSSLDNSASTNVLDSLGFQPAPLNSGFYQGVDDNGIVRTFENKDYEVVGADGAKQKKVIKKIQLDLILNK